MIPTSSAPLLVHLVVCSKQPGSRPVAIDCTGTAAREGQVAEAGRPLLVESHVWQNARREFAAPLRIGLFRCLSTEPVQWGLFGYHLKGIPEAPPRTGSRPSSSAPAMLTIDEAKKALAATFGVKPEAVEITIRG
jgi:hypothetical protein